MSTQLNGAINNSVTTITVDSTSGFSIAGKIKIGIEAIEYTGTTETTFTGCMRGLGPTVAASHLDNATVNQVVKTINDTTAEPLFYSIAFTMKGAVEEAVGEDADLSNAFLYGEDLSGGDFTANPAKLAGANLYNARLNNTDFSSTPGADLRRVLAYASDWSNADITNADVTGTNFYGAKGSGMTVAGVVGMSQCIQYGATGKLATPPTLTSVPVAPLTGPAAGSTAVTITGDNFGPTATVTFGGTAATSVVVTSPRTITCVTPAHAVGAVTVAVTTNEQVASAAAVFTFV